MPIASNGPAPYPPTGSVLEVIERHRKVGLPTPITTEVIERVTGTPGLAPRVMRALTLFDLIDGDGNPTAQFDELAKAPSESDFKDRLASVVRAAYADIFQYIDPSTASAEQLEGQFRNYTPRGQINRMVALFRGLCEFTGIIPEGQAKHEGKPQARPRPARPKSTKGSATNGKERAGTGKRGRAEGQGPETPDPTSPAATDPKQRYIDLLLKKAESEDSLDADLLNRIERVIGVEPETSGPDENAGGDR